MMQINDQQLFQTGLSSVFLGTFQMLEALDPSFAEKALSRISTSKPGKSQDIVHKSNMTETSDFEKKDDVYKTAAGRSTAEKPVIEKPVIEKPAGEKSTFTVSKDDLTKVIVQKIKKDRSNNQKIGLMLKNYGAAKVSELDVSKYEAFLTELSAL